jgi:hypothetical protein
MSIHRLVLSLAGLGLILGLGLVLHERAGAAQTVPPVLRARAIELVDGRGRVRAQMNVESDGEVVLRLRDANGTVRVKIGASEAGSGLLLANEETEPGVHILAKRTGTFVAVQRGQKRQVISP